MASTGGSQTRRPAFHAAVEKEKKHLLLARLHTVLCRVGQYCFAFWRLSSPVVVCRRL